MAVDLGFIRKTESWKLTDEYFPSKIGGKPAWLSQNFSSFNLLCNICKETCIFLLQIYAPHTDFLQTFHRTIYIFICRNPNCDKPNTNQNIKVLRSQLPRENKFYPSIPPDYHQPPQQLCNVNKLKEFCALCGIFAHSKCSKCHLIKYCSKMHQILHWKAIHRSICDPNRTDSKNFTTNSNVLFPEFELFIEDGDDIDGLSDDDDDNDNIKNEKGVKLTDSIFLKGSQYSVKELEAMSNKKEDICFQLFKKSIINNPEQVIRYNRGSSPLWISDNNIPDSSQIPKCPLCFSSRQFEFQIMPHLIQVLELDDLGASLDWGTICIYTCPRSCSIDNDSYTFEYAHKQDVVDDN